MLLLVSTSTHGQNREIHVNTYNDGDTCLWYKWRAELCSRIELDKIQDTENDWYFRFWTESQAIDIWKEANGNTLGKLTNWTKECTKYGEVRTHEIYFESSALKASAVDQIIALIDSTRISSIPDEESIDGWEIGVDGMTYIIETASSSDYYFKTYWTPSAQESVEEAILIENFARRILALASTKNHWADFSSRIPFECFTLGGLLIQCKPGILMD